MGGTNTRDRLQTAANAAVTLASLNEGQQRAAIMVLDAFISGMATGERIATEKAAATPATG